VLREAHRLQRTELLQKLQDRCRERMDSASELWPKHTAVDPNIICISEAPGSSYPGS